MTNGIDPYLIPRGTKKKFLKDLSEEEFRDRVVRPLFLKRGLRDGRELCGPDEEGKDCVFVGTDAVPQRCINRSEPWVSRRLRNGWVRPERGGGRSWS